MDTVGNVPAIEGRGRGPQTLQFMIVTLKEKDVKPTHFLLISFSYRKGISPKQQTKIRTKIFKLINNKRYQQNVSKDEEPLAITWKSANAITSTLYYAVSRYEETYVHQMTKSLIKNAYRKILSEMRLTEQDVQLNYLTTKNLDFTIDLATGREDFVGTAHLTNPTTPAIDWEQQTFLAPIPGSSDDDDEDEEHDDVMDEDSDEDEEDADESDQDDEKLAKRKKRKFAPPRKLKIKATPSDDEDLINEDFEEVIDERPQKRFRK